MTDIKGWFFLFFCFFVVANIFLSIFVQGCDIVLMDAAQKGNCRKKANRLFMNLNNSHHMSARINALHQLYTEDGIQELLVQV